MSFTNASKKQTKLAIAMMRQGVRAVLLKKELARELEVSRVHLSYVMHGHRESPELLERAMRIVVQKLGVRKS